MNLCVQPFLSVSVRTAEGCAVDKQQYSNTLPLSNKPFSVPTEIRKLANNSSQFHISYLSDNMPAGLLWVLGKFELMEGLFPAIPCPARQDATKKCGSPLPPFLTGHPWANGFTFQHHTLLTYKMRSWILWLANCAPRND